MSNRRRVIQLALPLLLVTLASGQNFDLTWYTIDGGGEMLSRGGDFELSGKIGQPDSGMLRGAEFELSGGFWFPIPAGDCNADGGVDLFDYGAAHPCLSGPEGGLPSPDCNCYDLDGDGDVDLSEVARFQAEFTGG